MFVCVYVLGSVTFRKEGRMRVCFCVEVCWPKQQQCVDVWGVLHSLEKGACVCVCLCVGVLVSVAYRWEGKMLVFVCQRVGKSGIKLFS